MADVDLYVGLGTVSNRRFVEHSISSSLVRLCEEYYSESDVLYMPIHDEHYARGGTAGPRVTSHNVGIPATHQPFQSFSGKYPSTDVVGNVGEGLGLAALVSLTNLPLRCVTRLKRKKKGAPATTDMGRKTPDFMADTRGVDSAGAETLTRLGTRLSEVDRDKLPQTWPDRYPLEAKATGKESVSSHFTNAAWQIIEYWHSVSVTNPSVAEAGWGVVLLTDSVMQARRRVSVAILAPTDPAAFVHAVSRLPTRRSSNKDIASHFGGRWPWVI